MSAPSQPPRILVLATGGTIAGQAGDAMRADYRPGQVGIEAYLEHNSNKFIGQFDPNCYLYLSRASDLFDIADHGATIEAGLAKIDVNRAMIIGVETDCLFPLYQQEELAEQLSIPGREFEYVALESIQGHDSFLVDMDRFRPTIARFFD